jgi:SET domain-containing protein
MELFVSTKIKIATSPIHGFGVFATESIDRDELIEECAFLELPIKPKESTSLLIDYRFNYPSGPLTDSSSQVIVLGAGSIYNHSDSNNAYWVTDQNRRTFKFYASKPIRAGEEILTYYGGAAYWNDGRSNTKIKANGSN